MSPRGRPKTRHPKEPETISSGFDPPTTEKESSQEKFPYEEGQVCADVKIVEIKPEVERSIGFVYAKRGVIKDDRDRILNTDGILQGQWRKEINWMTIPDFGSFVKAQLESGLFVKRGK